MNEKLIEYFNNDELATNVWLSKYAKEGEETPDDMHKRLAKEFARIEEKYNKKIDKKELDKLSEYGKKMLFLSFNKIYNLFKNFEYIVPQGSIMANLGAKEITSLSNCFVIGQPEDSYGGIFEKDEQLAQLMKRRGGVGIDISTLRPQGTQVSNAAKSSTGAISFMHRFSNTTREVAQGGRRGALMISIDINHPDVMEFIKIKRDLTQVTGANISIKLNNEFMKAVENDEDYILRFPCNQDISYFSKDYIKANYGELHYIEDHKNNNAIIYTRTIKAKEYWNEIIKSAHQSAEPGLMFWDNMLEGPDGVYPQYAPITTNPCSEIGMQEYDACRLIAVNLYSFVDKPFTEEAKFNFEKFYKINYEAMRLSDDLIDLELEHIERIIDKIDTDPESTEIKLREKELWKKIYSTAKNSRRTGLGFTALGDTLAALNLKYDSEDTLKIIEQIMRTKMESELDCTIDLAILRGTFEGWDTEKEYPTEQDINHEYHGEFTWRTNNFYMFIADNFDEQFKRLVKYGRRNVSFSTVAPTGSVSILTQTTSGIEPLFQPYYMRRKKINPNDKDVRVDFVDDNGDSWQEFPVLHPKFKDWIDYHLEKETGHPHDISDSLEDNQFNNKALHTLFEKSPWYQSTANDINWIKRVEIQAIIQKYITHSISSTINLPEDVSLEEVSDIYLSAHHMGLKGITVYRDGSRSGVLVTKKETKNSFKDEDAIKRPKELEAETHYSTTQGVGYHVIVGLLENKPYEVFIDDSENKYPENGILRKESKGKYIFIGDEEKIIVKDFMSPEQQAITRMASGLLRHKVHVKFIVEILNKVDGDMFSFAKSLARVLKKYIPDGEKSTLTCNECGSKNVIFEEGCSVCKDCGNSKCG